MRSLQEPNTVNTDCAGGFITNIQRFSVDDGPGIRTTVFLKGCTLSCRWCHNPETIKTERQLQYKSRECSSCGKCVSVCPVNAQIITGDIHSLKREKCVSCLKCADACFSGALSIIGEYINLENLCEKLLRDRSFYNESNGGVTLSGGEPLVQILFSANIFRFLKEQGIHTALDTAGNAAWSNFEEILPWTDLVLFDLKIIDEKKHYEMTESGNRLILENFIRLNQKNTRIWARIPVIPGINDSDEDADSFIEILKKGKNVEQVTLIPYHRYGLAKYIALGFDETPHTFQTPAASQMEKIKNRLQAAGIKNVIMQ